MNYTKGEWMADNGESELWGVFADDSKPIAYLGDDFGGMIVHNRDFEESKANAQLIASAPDLYEACNRALTIIESNLGDTHPLAIEKIRGALAKAEGK